jgi:hypothetical protein
MPGEIIVRPSKGDFLLFTVMNIAGYHENCGYAILHPLRHKARQRYSQEINNPVILEFYDVWSNYFRKGRAGAVADDIQMMEFGLEPACNEHVTQLRNILDNFRKSCDFDSFYEEIAGEYRVVCQESKNALKDVPIIETLDQAWECEPNLQFYVIPRPLDSVYAGHEAMIGENALAMVSPLVAGTEVTFDDLGLRDIVGHEFSHFYAKEIKDQMLQISESRDIKGRAEDFFKTQKARGYSGSNVIDETLIRAMQTRYINPFLEFERMTVGERLEYHHERHGFEHIRAFDEAIREHKENPKGTLAEAMVETIEKLIE